MLLSVWPTRYDSCGSLDVGRGPTDYYRDSDNGAVATSQKQRWQRLKYDIPLQTHVKSTRVRLDQYESTRPTVTRSRHTAS